VLRALEQLYVFEWTDPAAPLLDLWRTCVMVSIFESEHPCLGVPHIVITNALPNAPWDTELALAPEQDERFLTVPVFAYMMVVEEEEEQLDDKWYSGDDEEEVPSRLARWSESEEDSDDVGTPSPPSWPMRTFPTSTGRRASTLADVFEEDDEDTYEPPSVLDARFRRTSFLNEDDADVPPPVTSTLSARFNFSTTLCGIGERTPEDVYRPLTAGCKPLWTATAMIAMFNGADDSEDGHSHYTDALEDSDAQSQYVDAEQSEYEETDHSHDVPRPSCDLFLYEEDEEGSHLPRGKANIPAGKSDWFDLLDDSDLGSLDWPASATANDDT
jgi:hypothetical protein